MRRLLAVAVAASIAAGCGTDEEPKAAAQTETQTQRTTETSTTTAPSQDELELRRLGDAYIHAVGSSDHEAACRTLTPRARARFRRKAGSCQALFRATEPKNPGDAAARLQVNRARIDGDRATLEIGEPGRTDVISRYYAAKLDGRWYLMVKRAAKGAP